MQKNCLIFPAKSFIISLKETAVYVLPLQEEDGAFQKKGLEDSGFQGLHMPTGV